MVTEQAARDSLEVFNQGDYEAIRALMGPGFVYEESGTGRRITDVDEVLEAFRAWRTALPDVVGTMERLLIDGDTVAMELRWRGTHTGPLQTPTGDIPATGRPVDIPATMWQEWKDGRLSSERHHLDVFALMAQIGAVPAAV